MLARNVSLRKPLTVKRRPRLAQLYCRAFHDPSNRWRSRVCRCFFLSYYALHFPSRGEFEYERFGQRRTVSFNARNLQFQALYAPYFRHGYEPDVAILIDALLPEGGTFYDVGSNWGYFSLYAASTRERVNVHAFEALPGTHEDLVQCVAQAGIQDFVTCHAIALSSADGESFIGLPDGLHSGQATLSPNEGELKILTRRLDGLKLPAPDLIKMDVEGHELEVLRGALETLRSHRPFLIFENKRFDDVPAKTLAPLFLLAELGYEMFVPVLRRRTSGPEYLIAAGGQEIGQQDQWVLQPLDPKTRLLWQQDLNIFACHQGRLSELAAAFND